MNKKKRDGYVAGIGCFFGFAVLLALAVNNEWNISGQILWAFTVIFGGLGVGCFWKPETFGAAVSKYFERFSEGEKGKSDSHNKQIQRESSGSVQVMTGDRAEVHINVPSVEKKQTQESDVGGSTLWKPLPRINFIVAQRLLRKLQFPTVGWEAYNDSPYQLRVRIEVHPILGGRDLFPLSDNALNGTDVFEVEPQSALFGNGCFSLPEICAIRKDEDLILEIRAKVEDINNPEKGQYKLVPQRWKYIRESGTWSYYPQRPMTR